MPGELTLLERLEVLAGGARYDVSCASSGSRRKNGNGIGSASPCGICHSWTSDGRCVSLLKLLMTNACIYDCAYCPNRRSNDLPRTLPAPEEIAELTIGFYRRNYIEGLFLSTGVVRDPDYTMEQLIRSVWLLREAYRFNGYIHLKVVPGADPLLVEEAGRHADRLSVNIELPTRESLMLLAPDKSGEAILHPMRRIADLIRWRRDGRRARTAAPPFAPAGQSTQMIVGATGETDLQIMRLAENLYRTVELKRVYYSSFIPVNEDSRLPCATAPLLSREHRLYQADWLLRFYGFRSHEFLDEQHPQLDPAVDPKCGWALRHLHLFPVEVNRADYETLLRVPGIGVRSARRIVRARRRQHLGLDELPLLGVVMKRARYFITARGKYGGEEYLDGDRLRERLVEKRLTRDGEESQLSLFPAGEPAPGSAVTGEL